MTLFRLIVLRLEVHISYIYIYNTSHTHTHHSSQTTLTQHISQSHLSHTTHLTHTHTHSHNSFHTVISHNTPLTQLTESQSVAPATQKYCQMHKVLRPPRKSSARCTKCCACHGTATGPPRRPNARRQVPDSQSVAPATQK